MLPVLLLLHQARCPHHNNSRSCCNDFHPPIQDGQSAAFHLPLSLGNRQLRRSHLLFHLFFEHSSWLSGLREQPLKNKPFHGTERTTSRMMHLQKMINIHLIFLTCAASWTNVCTSQFSQLVLMGLKCLLITMPVAAPVEAVGHGRLSQGLGIWTLCILPSCMLAVLHFWSCEAPQLLLNLSSSVMGNYNAGKSQRFMNLWYVPCHYENCAAWHSQHFI